MMILLTQTKNILEIILHELNTDSFFPSPHPSPAIQTNILVYDVGGRGGLLSSANIRIFIEGAYTS